MAKLLKIIARTIGISLEWVLVFVVLFAFAIRTSTFQTWLGGVATDYLSDELDTEIRIGKVDIVILNRVLLKDVFVRDTNGDTLASVGLIDVHISDLGLSGGEITVSKALITDGRIGINRDAKTGDFNYGFLVDYFGSDTPPDPNSKPTKLKVKEINLSRVNLSYDDNRKPRSEYGIDYDHLFFRNVSLRANSFTSDENGVMGLNIRHFSATEQCGLRLDQLKLAMTIDPKKGVLLKNIEIRTPKTKIYASKFNLRVKDFKDFEHFNSKVRFDAKIDSSEIDLHDVSLFVPDLEGMDQKVYLSTELKKPLNWLALNELDLRFGSRSVVRGDFVLPDFSKLNSSELHEEISYCFVDLADVKALHLPKSAGSKGIQLEPMIERLAYVELKRTTVEGTMKRFVLASNRITTQLGALRINNGVEFTALGDGGFGFHRTANSNYDVAVDSFQLGKFLGNDMLGKVQGEFFLTGVAGQKDVIRLTELAGDIQRFGFNDYPYSNIKVTEGSFINNVFDADIAINDPHLKMTYDGSVDVNKIQKFDFDLKIKQADLGDLNFGNDKSAGIVGDLDIDLKGTNIDDYDGKVIVTNLAYTQNNKKIEVPDLNVKLTRGNPTDNLTILSEVADIVVNGKMTSANLVNTLNNSFAELLPTIIEPVKISTKKATHEFFTATITTKKTEEVFDLFYPELHVASGSVITASYDSRTDVQKMNITSSEVAIIPVSNDSTVQKQFFQNLVVKQNLDHGDLTLEIDADKAEYNDSLYVRNFDVDITGTKGKFVSKILWNQGMADPASFEFDTELKENDEYDFVVKPSYFSVESQKWEIKNQSEVSFHKERIYIDRLKLERDTQFVQIDGVMSNNVEEKLSLNLNKLHVEEFSKILDPTLDVSGILNGTVDLRTPFTSLSASGDLSLSKFFMNKQEIGTINLDGIWNPVKEMVSMNGNLEYLGNKTFDFYGSFYPLREDNNYSIDLRFRNTDLAFANAFAPVDVVSDIKGKLEGRLKLTGKTAAPIISGKVALKEGSVKVAMLGTTYTMNGDLKFDGENDFITALFPVKDAENNLAMLDVQISHSDFSNFAVNLDFWFDEESVYGVYRRPFTGKFMVLDTKYKQGDIYYGKAYASGFANISIQENLVDISVSATTEKGTVVDLPMYGASDISDFAFIEFTDGTDTDKKKPVNLSGVELALNINATEDAQINLIFNPKTGDAIDARGNGLIQITIPQSNEVKMYGTYTLASGGYNMNMPPIKERFVLKEGGTINWSGSPYETNLNLSTYVKVNASVSDLAGGTADGSKFGKKPVFCYMNITGKLSKPDIGLSLEMPTGSSEEKSLITRATSTEDDTQSQWFSLLTFRKFRPLNGEGGGGAGGAYSLLATQANDWLGNLKPAGIDLSVGAGAGETTVSGEKVINPRIKIVGELGKSTSGEGSDATSSTLFNIRVDLLFNEDGTFKMTAFNESNDKSSVGGSENGDFTQGVSISYSEQFNRFSESNLLKFVTDPANRTGKRKKKKKNTVTVEKAQEALKPKDTEKAPENPPAKTEEGS